MAQALQDNDQSSLLVVHEALLKQGAPEEANFQPWKSKGAPPGLIRELLRDNND